jgi:hypothetical protein
MVIESKKMKCKIHIATERKSYLCVYVYELSWPPPVGCGRAPGVGRWVYVLPYPA